MESSSELDRLHFFEQARKISEATYASNPLDADAGFLLLWAGALLELSQFQSIPDSQKMIQDAISKLEEALKMRPGLTSKRQLNISNKQLMRFFCSFDPSNEIYLKSLEISATILGSRRYGVIECDPLVRKGLEKTVSSL
ncbi:hypothetical protein ES332_A06G115200v1 [Gossypium tomentosum]|uniref:Uncharacterized protein n=1 Tax=Gossypium tomentosum TaxID=34277 RepID=A0A5D2Q2E5_GOSTO|nr:hypothetical protein ES332_A06G115200v1 [Gossypium tomentosum]